MTIAMDDFGRKTMVGKPIPHTASLFGGDGLALEACCGNRRAWSHDKPRRIVFMDVMPAVHPQIVGSVMALPFADGVFDEIFFDPPHLIRGEDWTSMNRRYEHFGVWRRRSEWEEALRRANEEFHRVSRAGTTLRVKIIDGKDRRVTKLADLDMLTMWARVELRLRPSRVAWSTCQTVSATFIRKDIAE